MVQINNIAALKEKRKYLRNNATPAERTLWQLLKKKKTGFKFRRQHSVDNFILDFYCTDKKLAIELDGDVHDSDEAVKKDKFRTEQLNHCGIKVIRFRNDEVLQRPEAVVEKIKEQLI